MDTPDTLAAPQHQVDPFDVSFRPAHEAVRLLAEIANGTAGSLARQRAADAVNAWRDSLATPAQISVVETSDDLEIDDEGACVSLGEGGFFIQAWSWVSYQDHPELEPGVEDDDGSAEPTT